MPSRQKQRLNTEMTLIVDVDLDLLKDLHYNGSVRTLTDRRTDIYKLERIQPIADESNGNDKNITKSAPDKIPST